MKSSRSIKIFFFVAILAYLWSCEDNKPDNFGREPYDPSKPVKIEGFKPDSGGLATKVFITGSNFGSDVSNIKVYFNDTRASVVGSNGKSIYAITPRQPGEENVISVVVGKDSTTLVGKKFRYRSMLTVTTLTGKKGTSAFKEGTLAEAEFHEPYGMVIDKEGNLFVNHWHEPLCFLLINEEKDIVKPLLLGNGYLEYCLGWPSMDTKGVVYAPSNEGDTYRTFDPEMQWMPRSRTIIQPTEEMLAQGKKGWPTTNNWKHSMACCLLEGHNYIYTCYYTGHLVRFDPVTRQGECVLEHTLLRENIRLYFNPIEPNILFIS